MSKFDWHGEAKKKWDDGAGYWNKNSEQMWETGSRKEIIPFLLEYVEPLHDIHIVDVGCGDGYGSWKLANHGFAVTGVDLSEEMINRAKERDLCDNLSFVQGDLTELPFEDHSFSLAMAINALEWTKVPSDALNELKRVIKNEGLLLVGILGPTAKPRVNSYSRLYGENVVMNTMMPWEFEQLAVENGWEVIDGKGVYKKAVHHHHLKGLAHELKQSLSFMWLFLLKQKEA